MQATDDDLELTTQGSNVLLPSGELVPDSNSNISEDDDNEDSRDDSVYFEKEVIDISTRMLVMITHFCKLIACPLLFSGRSNFP